MILFQEKENPDTWKKVRHAIIVLTDGQNNMGPPPKHLVAKIEDVLEIKPDRNDYLDIYAFGVGTLNVDWDGLNAIASKKEGERHAFKLDSSQDLKAAFDDILDLRNIGDTCGLGNNSLSATAQQRAPWHVVIKAMKVDSCRGSLISDSWVLTAAHCFNKWQDTSHWRVRVGREDIPIQRWLLHPAYNVSAKAAEGIPEFYDYDVALVQLQHAVRFSGLVRPICLPCTVGASQALKEKRRKTCREHERELLGREQVPAHFISLGGDSLSVRIKANQLRPSCIAGAIQPGMIYANVSSVSHVVTDRFLCSGQISGGSEEASTCKGESGGALFLEKKLRNFQVGVVSWGTASPCQPGPGGTVQRKPLPKHHVPRDFYISLFAVQDWLRQVLGGAVAFVPLQ